MRGALGPLQIKALETMRGVLSDEFFTLSFSDYRLEAMREGPSHIACTVIENPGDRHFELRGEGVGLVDAIFGALCERYQSQHPSLQTISFSGFSVRALPGDARRERPSAAKAEAAVGIRNSSGREFEFTAISNSVGDSSIEAVLAAVEYFVNSERAYVRVYEALQHHKTTGRIDLVGRYTELLAEIVQNTSYSSAVERLKQLGR